MVVNVLSTKKKVFANVLSTKEKVFANVDSTQIENSHSEKLLEDIIDNKLNFEEHVKARSELNTLSKVTPFMKLDQRKPIMNAFFKAQLSYFLLVWMIYSHKLNNKINRLHERCLRVI